MKTIVELLIALRKQVEESDLFYGMCGEIEDIPNITEQEKEELSSYLLTHKPKKSSSLWWWWCPYDDKTPRRIYLEKKKEKSLILK